MRGGNVGGLGDVRLHRNRLAACGDDGVDDGVCLGCAVCVVDDNVRAVGCQTPCDARAQLSGHAGGPHNTPEDLMAHRCINVRLAGSIYR